MHARNIYCVSGAGLRENAMTMIVLQIWSVSEVEMSDYYKVL